MRENRVNSATDRACCEQLGFGSDLRGNAIDVLGESRSAVSIHELSKKSLAINGPLRGALARVVERVGDCSGQQINVLDRFAHVAPDPFQSLGIKVN